MGDELVMDASVAVKCLIAEEGSVAALALSVSGPMIVAPALVRLELASVIARKTRKGEIPADAAARLLDDAALLFDLTAPTEPLVARALALAVEHGFSVYDAIYLALAETRGTHVVTADVKLAARARAAGLGGLVQTLA